MAIIVSVVTYGAGTGFGYAILAGAAGGMTGALLNGANFGQIMKAGAVGAFWGGLSAAVSVGIGELAKNGGMQLLGKMYAHGISQGAITAAQGGKFRHGFFAGAFTAGLAPGIQNSAKSNVCKVLASSVIGGTASVLGGGKFANGAITGAFVMLFNHMRHEEEGGKPKKMGWLGRKIQNQLDNDFDKSLFENYWTGGGDITLTDEQFNDIASVAKIKEDSPGFFIERNGQIVKQHRVSFYGTKYAAAFGEADMFYRNGIPVGFSDTYDFNPYPIRWGNGKFFDAQLKTELVDMASWFKRGAKGFNINY